MPDLLKPTVKYILFNSACLALLAGWFSIPAGFALHEDEFHVILDNCVRLVGLPQELRSVFNLVGGVGDFMPDDWVQVVESDPSADDADVSVQGKYKVASKIAARDTDIPDHANKPAPGYEDSVHMPPNLFQLE